MDGRENYSCIQGLSHSNQLYISASSSMSVTVSGSPTMRKLLFGTSLPFQNLQFREIPIRGPYHARHLFKQSDVEKIIDADIIRHLNQYSLIHPIVGLSTSTTPSSTIDCQKLCCRHTLSSCNWRPRIGYGPYSPVQQPCICAQGWRWPPIIPRRWRFVVRPESDPQECQW